MSSFTLSPLSLAAGEDIIPLARVKAQLKVVEGFEDELLAVYRDAAIDAVQQYCMRRLSPASIKWEGSFGGEISLGVADVRSVESITYLDAAGASQPMPVGDVRIIQGRHVVPMPGKDWPSDALCGSVHIRFTAGYGTTGTGPTLDVRPIPPALISAALLMLGHLSKHREAVVVGTISSEIPLGFMALCNVFRDPVVG
jgi:uncharacterized phiE125 gp8 family phage protein